MGNFLIYVAEKVFDTFVNGFRNIDTDHYYIHAGKKFGYGEIVTLGAGATRLITFTTPSVASGKQVHYRPALITTSADKLTIELIENNFVNGSGTNKLTSIYNFNRSSSNTTAMQFFNVGETETTPGIVILPDYIGGGTATGGGSGGNRQGSGNEQQEERVLKVNTNYSVKLTNGSAGNNVVKIFMNWYEESVYTG